MLEGVQIFIMAARSKTYESTHLTHQKGVEELTELYNMKMGLGIIWIIQHKSGETWFPFMGVLVNRVHNT